MPSLVGIWKLVEARVFNHSGEELPSPLGPQPMGIAIFDAQRAIATAGDGRVTLPPDVSKARVCRLLRALHVRRNGAGDSYATAPQVRTCWRTKFVIFDLKAPHAWSWSPSPGYLDWAAAWSWSGKGSTEGSHTCRSLGASRANPS